MNIRSINNFVAFIDKDQTGWIPSSIFSELDVNYVPPEIVPTTPDIQIYYADFINPEEEKNDLKLNKKVLSKVKVTLQDIFLPIKSLINSENLSIDRLFLTYDIDRS